FYAVSLPPITIQDYLIRIMTYSPVPNNVLLSIVVYIERIVARTREHPEFQSFRICALSIHRLVITAITISSKYHCDNVYTNARFAKVGGLTMSHLRDLENQLLILLDFDLRV
ncbi:hypothetical protein SISSUDRAFT_959083, partial [Sistotremastrum suecicum HHB10207 ss-3]